MEINISRLVAAQKAFVATDIEQFGEGLGVVVVYVFASSVKAVNSLVSTEAGVVGGFYAASLHCRHVCATALSTIWRRLGWISGTFLQFYWCFTFNEVAFW